ncbi:tRNA pseudouridine(38-40) synthase TruA [bacterium]|nr:MAG: tRNA pseudouridine(38-40) synthase TruA [bacterium]
MSNIKLIIEYDGTNYAGWQVQNGSQKRTIQEIIEKALQEILQEKVKVTASGRTDAGVHALSQPANFKTRSRLSPVKIKDALNALLPEDIAIKRVSRADEDFNSCRSAKSKLYRYLILNSRLKSAFLCRHSWRVLHPLNLKLMQSEARVLRGRQDFKAFCASGSSAKTTTRTIKKISVKSIRYQLSAISYPLIAIDIESDGFLYNMARNIAGTLVEIGRGRFKEGDLKKILFSRDRRQAGPKAPSRGLFLAKVRY